MSGNRPFGVGLIGLLLALNGLDARQVRDRRGISAGKGVALGGGLAGIVALVLTLLMGGDPSRLTGALSGEQVGAQQESDLSAECRTGADANERDDCRIVGYVNGGQAYWGEAVRGYQLAPTTFFGGGVSTGCGYADSSVGPFCCLAERLDEKLGGQAVGLAWG